MQNDVEDNIRLEVRLNIEVDILHAKKISLNNPEFCLYS
jgi:hypothetical protein